MKKYEVLVSATTWINLKRPHIIWLHLYEMSRNGKSTETESRLEAGSGN